MYYDEHNPPHIHAEYQDSRDLLHFQDTILKGDLRTWTALKLVREWIDLRHKELIKDWAMASLGKEIKKVDPLN